VLAALLFEVYGFHTNSGSLAIFAAIRRALIPPAACYSIHVVQTGCE
jgi:hypothetical protein